MLEQVLAHLNNWFLVPDGVHEGTFTIADGGITLPFMQDGQYFRIIGSVFNDGLHQYPASDLTAETFDGAIWALAVPKAILSMAEEIAAWQDKNGDAATSPYTSESFGGYSYTKAADAGGKPVSWQGVFASQLNAYKKPREMGFVQPTRRSSTYTRPYNPDFPWR